MKTAPQHSFHPSRRAFTLVESAIVLAIVGLVVGAVFAAAKFVSGENAEIKDVLRQNFTVASNIQSQYNAIAPGGVPGDWTSGANITQHLNTLQLIPGEMATSNPANFQHALGGPFFVYVASIPNAQGDEFILKLQSLSPSACTSLLLNLPLSDPGFGYNSVAVNGTTEITISTGGNGIVLNPSTNWPITPALAASWCGAAGKTNEIDIGYKIHP